MSLVTNVQSRYSVQLLANLTNPQDPSVTVFDATKLGNASIDVEADFEIYCGVAYDDLDPRHVNVAVEGVITKLRIRTGQYNAEELQDKWISRLRELARVTGRDRILPLTEGTLVPSREGDGITPPQPDFDRARFRYYIEGEPNAVPPQNE